MPTLRLLATLATIAIGLAALEWWSVNTLDESGKFAGPITGVAFVAALALLPHLLSKFTGHWYNAVVAALTALVELMFCVVISSSLSAIAVVLLPVSITGRFMQGDSATDFIIFLMLAIGLFIAARGWSKYSSQALLASKAQLETERARSQLAERDRVRVAAAIPGMQSALVLTPSAKGALLTGVDLARLPLRGTELVVLSACDTGNGSVDVGEGVVSLRMAVEEAGAKSAVTSLWPVPSESTAQLMRTFYEQIELGKSKSDALREAKIQLMKFSPKPIQWAGFLLSGQP